MRRITVALPLLLLSGLAAAQDNACGAIATAMSESSAAAPELAAPSHRLGAPSGVLAQAYDEAQSVDGVLSRLRVSECREVAATRKKKPVPKTDAAAAPAAAQPAVVDPATYKPKTAHDNTPWRFDMNQNGKRMTAEEFDAWMKARGVRVAKGAPAKVPAPEAAPAADSKAK